MRIARDANQYLELTFLASFGDNFVRMPRSKRETAAEGSGDAEDDDVYDYPEDEDDEDEEYVQLELDANASANNRPTLIGFLFLLFSLSRRVWPNQHYRGATCEGQY